MSAESSAAVETNGPDYPASIAAEAGKEFLSSSASEWAGKILDGIAAAANDESGEKIKSLASPENIKLFDTEKLAQTIENSVYAAAASGAAQKSDALSTPEGNKQ